MKITILGYGQQGRSAYEYWKKPENEITICDRNSNIKIPIKAGSNLGVGYLKDLDKFDLIVRSPSIAPKEIVESNSPNILKKVTSVTNEFFKVCPTKNIIGITGTKGKGTTSTLIAKLLEASGQKVHLGGNIGVAPLDLLKNNIRENDWVVLELANFQLIDLKYSPRIAVCLMVVPEHLDWHADEKHYYDSKKPLFTHQTKEDYAIYFAKNSLSKEIADGGNGQKIPYYEKPGAVTENNNLVIDDQVICSVDDFKLPGKHNWQNICAAVTVLWQINRNPDVVRKVITNFGGLPYRLELVRELNGVKYYNDSFGTAPQTATVALEAFKQPKIVILGGRSKGIPLNSIGEAVMKNNVKNVIAIGETGFEIMKILEKAGYTGVIKGEKDMDSIVRQAQDLAIPGDIVLLSPACASFDMFNNYADRGDKFNIAVNSLN